MYVVLLVVEYSTGQDFLEIGLQDPVFACVVSHECLPVLPLDCAAFVGAHERSASGQGCLDSILKVLPDEMVLQLTVLVLRPGSEAADHADVASLGKNSLLWHCHCFF